MDEKQAHEHRPRGSDEAPENRPEEPGAEGGTGSPSRDALPAEPADDDAPVGDTDQHSSG